LVRHGERFIAIWSVRECQAAVQAAKTGWTLFRILLAVDPDALSIQVTTEDLRVNDRFSWTILCFNLILTRLKCRCFAHSAEWWCE
jgi:hypothetical protein